LLHLRSPFAPLGVPLIAVLLLLLLGYLAVCASAHGLLSKSPDPWIALIAVILLAIAQFVPFPFCHVASHFGKSMQRAMLVANGTQGTTYVEALAVFAQMPSLVHGAAFA